MTGTTVEGPEVSSTDAGGGQKLSVQKREEKKSVIESEKARGRGKNTLV